LSEILVYTDPNHRIIERCKEGDRLAYKELYDLYSRAMFNTSMRIVNNREEAEDILQESFVKAFQRLHQYSAKVSFGSWLRRIVINHSIDRVKKRNDFLLSLQEDHHDIEEDSQSEYTELYTVEIIRQCISSLPDGYRTILTLYLFENYTHKEIATILCISEGTSKSQYMRAKQKLAEMVKQCQHSYHKPNY
jgi:RNA polymerase sigma factor (sigma-70 family)